jgi:hypothetical protein
MAAIEKLYSLPKLQGPVLQETKFYYPNMSMCWTWGLQSSDYKELESSGIWHHAVQWKITNISEECTASI